jgi:hypothetical protein
MNTSFFCRYMAAVIVGLAGIMPVGAVARAGIPREVEDAIKEIAERQKELLSFSAIQVNHRSGQAVSCDQLHADITNGRYRIDEGIFSRPNTVILGKTPRFTRYCDGIGYWEEVGNLIAAASNCVCSIQDLVFVNLQNGMEGVGRIVTNDTEFVVLERDAINPLVAQFSERVQDPKMIDGLKSKGIGTTEVVMATATLQKLPPWTERIWVARETGIWTKREIRTPGGDLYSWSVLSNLQIGVTFPPDFFQPTTQGKHLIKTTCPFDLAARQAISDERRKAAYQAFVVVSQPATDADVERTILVRFGELWKNRDMDALRKEITGQSLGTPHLASVWLANAIYSGLIDGETRLAQELLRKAEKSLPEKKAREYEDFKAAYLQLEKILERVEKRELRVETLREKYPGTFPLTKEIISLINSN